MIRNYFKIAWRTLWRNKTFSAINITGLSLGTACSLFILLWVQDERRVNSFHANNSQLYAVYQREYSDGGAGAAYATPGPLAEELKKVIPDITLASGFSGDNNILRAGNKILRETGAYAGNDFLRMFSFPLLAGREDMALHTPNSIALSEKLAVAFFGSAGAAIGKTITYNSSQYFTVTAVFENVPDHSSLKFDYLINWAAMLKKYSWANTWSSTGVNTYVMLDKHADPAKVRTRISNFLDDYYKEQGPGLREELDLQRFDEKYLHGSFQNGFISGGRITYVILFTVVAAFVLLIACINFMNLSTARSLKRAKEIGVRKAAGAMKQSLIIQFISEAVLTAFLALALAVILVALLLPAFNAITGKQMTLPVTAPLFWLQLLAIGMITGLFAGSYPALYLSSFEAVKVLKGTLRPEKNERVFRKGLVVFQFVLSTLLFIGAITISRQVEYIQTKNLGYDREHIINIPLEGALIPHYDYFKETAQQLPGVKLVSAMNGSPVGFNSNQDGILWEGKDPSYRPTITVGTVGYDYVNTMGLQVIRGRDFSRQYPTDSGAVLINETAARKIGFKDPLGKYLVIEPGLRRQIIGVVKDFHAGSLHDQIDPVIMQPGPATWGTLLVKTAPGKTAAVIASLEKLCKTVNPEYPFRYQLADEEYRQLYRGEQMVKKLTGYFTVMAIVISCLGLLGLAQFTTQQRIREISIRKVLGANARQIFGLLSGEFMLLIVLAFLIAIPAAWWGMHQWLDNYAYHISLSWWIFALAGGISFLIVLITVSSLTIKVSVSNPAKHLHAN
ncbi:ABC transporter permease [Chitinophaga sp.]|uniref:ABC transporter permease n=1 Tax=Chitinophaga sp. TaxID=1869181 RepID=UPI002F929CA4